MAQPVEIRVAWKGGEAFTAQAPDGAELRMGRLTPEHHGLAPMETLLASVAGCSGVDVVLILGKMRKTLQALEMRISGRRREAHPRVYTQVHITYVLHGPDLDEASVERAIRLSLEKYCSAAATVGAYARITYAFEIHTNGQVIQRGETWLEGTPRLPDTDH